MTARTGTKEFDPTHSTVHLLPYHVSQHVPIDVERGCAVDCRRIGLGFALAIRLLLRPVPFAFDGRGGFGVVRRRGGHGHRGDERR